MDKKVVIVIGASSGIGTATVTQLLADGYVVPADELVTAFPGIPKK